MLNNCNLNCRHHLVVLFLQVFPFPDVLECCLVLLHLGSQCPPELQEQALALLRKHGGAGVYRKAARSFSTWHLRANCLPWAASSYWTLRLFFFQVKASFDGCGCYWYKMSGLYTSTDTYLRRLLENWKAVVNCYNWFLYSFFYLLDTMLLKALAIYMQEKVLSSCVVFQQRRKSSCPQENQWFL